MEDISLGVDWAHEYVCATGRHGAPNIPLFFHIYIHFESNAPALGRNGYITCLKKSKRAALVLSLLERRAAAPPVVYYELVPRT